MPTEKEIELEARLVAIENRGQHGGPSVLG